jgi:hypothetical protein
MGILVEAKPSGGSFKDRTLSANHRRHLGFAFVLVFSLLHSLIRQDMNTLHVTKAAEKNVQPAGHKDSS